MNYKWLYKIKYSQRDEYEKIYNERYSNSSTYRYNFNVGNHPIFVSLEPEILSMITKIQMLDKTLFALKSVLPDLAISQFSKKCLIDEVRLTNELEGVASTRKEIKDILENRNNENSRLKGIVQKYNMLMTSNKIPLTTCRDIRTLYDELLIEEISQSDSKNIPDGDIFRKDKVYVKDRQSGEIIHQGLYPETMIIENMSALLSIFDNPEFNPFINIAVFHYMFGYIHPFYDGNGRTSRFISSYFLSEYLEYIVGFRLAYTIKKDLPKYHKMFKLTNEPTNRGDLTPFTIYFLEMIQNSLEDLVSYFTDKSEKLQFYTDKLYSTNLPTECKDMAYILLQNSMFGEEGLSMEEMSYIFEKSPSTIRRVLKLLEEKSMLRITTGKPYLYDIVL